MKRNNHFALKIMSTIIAVTVLLSGCSEQEKVKIDTVASSDETAGNSQTENSDHTSQITSLPAESSSKSEANSSTAATSTIKSTVTSSLSTTSETTSSTTVSSTTTGEPTSTVQSSTSTATSLTEPSSSTTTSTSSTATSMSSSKPSSTATSTSSNKSSSSSSVTTPEITPGLDENEIYKVLISFKEKYPDGTPWTNETRSYKSYTIFPQYSYYMGQGCAAFALELSDAAFGDLPAKEHYDISGIRVGDIIRINNNSHSAIVLEVHSDGVIIAEGNINSQVLWGRKLSTADLQEKLTYIWTRYP